MADQKMFSPIPNGGGLPRANVDNFMVGVVFQDQNGRLFFKEGRDNSYQEFDRANRIPFGATVGKNGVLARTEGDFKAIGRYRIPTSKDLQRIQDEKVKVLDYGPNTASVVPGSEPKVVEPYDHVEKPSHYFLIEPCEKYPNGVELNDLIWEKPINIGAAIKYLMRMGKKPGNSELQEIRKAHKHLELEIGHRKARGDAET